MRYFVQLFRLQLAGERPEHQDHAVYKGKHARCPGQDRKQQQPGLCAPYIHLPNIKHGGEEHLFAQEAAERRKPGHGKGANQRYGKSNRHQGH
ncbi:hypothetical protein D3C73_784710 [compost metagenome]